MRILKFYFLFLIILIPGIKTSAQKRISLNEAISIALKQNPSIKKSTYNLEATDEAVKTAYGALIPTLGVNGSFDWQHTNYNSKALTNLTGVPRKNPKTMKEKIGS